MSKTDFQNGFALGCASGGIVEVPAKEEQEKTATITENGMVEVLPDENMALSKVTVDVNVPSKEEQEKTITITENGTTEILPDENKALSKVTVVTDVEGGGGALLDNTVTFTVDGEPYEIVSVKSGNSVNAPATEPINNGLLLTSWKVNDTEVSFPFTPTENCEISGEFSEYQIVRNLTTNDISYKRGFYTGGASENPPYSQSASSRAGYFYHDIPIEYGYTYKFDFVSTSANAQVALVFFTDTTLSEIAKGSTLSLENQYDTSWQESGFEYEVPETYNGSPIRRVILSFRMSSNNENVVSGFIQSVTISRKLAN